MDEKGAVNGLRIKEVFSFLDNMSERHWNRRQENPEHEHTVSLPKDG